MSHRHCGNCGMEMDSYDRLCQVCYIKEDITKALERITRVEEPEEEDERHGLVSGLLRRLR